MTRDDAILEAKLRWPPDPMDLGDVQHWGAIKEGLFLAVGIGEFTFTDGDVAMTDFVVKGYGKDWEAAFAMARGKP